MFRLQKDIEKQTVGWTCPKCGSVYSPSVKQCVDCSKKENKEPNRQRLDD